MCAVRYFDFISGPQADSLLGGGVIDTISSASKGTSYVITDTDGYSVIYATAGGITITLPAVATNTNRRIVIINDSTGVITVDANGTETIDGIQTYYLYRRYDSIYVHCTGSKWVSIALPTQQRGQNFTTIENVGSSTSQQFAGHQFLHSSGGYNEPNTSWSEVLAYYEFASADITVDTKGSYTLANTNATNTTGILNTNYAIDLNGTTAYMTQATLLDTLPTALAVDFWYNADDGQPATEMKLWEKVNDETGGSNDRIYSSINTNGNLDTYVVVNGTVYSVILQGLLPNGSTGWHYYCLNWDTSNGLRLWHDGVLLGSDQTATSLLSAGSTRDFIIGATNYTGVVTQYFDGKIACFRVRDKVLKQNDIDIAYSTTYPNLLGEVGISVPASIQPLGDTDFEMKFNFDGVISHLDTTYIYRAGANLCNLQTTDKLKYYLKR